MEITIYSTTTCQALDKNINANLVTIPANTVIVKTDYDSSNDLKKKYGVHLRL